MQFLPPFTQLFESAGNRPPFHHEVWPHKLPLFCACRSIERGGKGKVYPLCSSAFWENIFKGSYILGYFSPSFLDVKVLFSQAAWSSPTIFHLAWVRHKLALEDDEKGERFLSPALLDPDSDIMFHFQYLRHVPATANWTIWLQETRDEEVRQQMSMKWLLSMPFREDWLFNAQPALMEAYLRLFCWKCDTRDETSLLINQWHQDPTLR